MSLNASSTLKYSAFSWASVLWRILIAAAVYSCSIWFWFGGWHILATNANGDSCSFKLYFFGPRAIDEQSRYASLEMWFRAGTLIIAIPILYMVLVFWNIVNRILAFLVTRALPVPQTSDNAVSERRSGRLAQLQNSLVSLCSVRLRALVGPDALSGLLGKTWQTGSLDANGIDPATKNEEYSNSDVIKAYLSILSGAPETIPDGVKVVSFTDRSVSHANARRLMLTLKGLASSPCGLYCILSPSLQWSSL